MSPEAKALLQAWDRAEPIPPLSNTRDLSPADAYAIADEVKSARIARSERPVGRKIGFTNRTIWDTFGVSAPIWGWVYHTTFGQIPGDGKICLSGVAEPRIEPEISFHLRATPSPDMDILALAGCIDWFAAGFEIVTSPYANWKFKAPDTMAAQGMHARLYLGPRIPMSKVTTQQLEEFSTRLTGPGQSFDGQARNVLDGPLHALAHLMQELAAHGSDPLGEGEVVTTGTLTDAPYIHPGEGCFPGFAGLPAPNLRVHFT